MEKSPSAADFERSSELSVQQLHTFRLVMQQGGYAAAARVSSLSVPSVWQHIQTLEKTYGVELFKRVGRQVQPTLAAGRLYGQVDEILIRLESTFGVVRDTANDETIRLVTGVRMMMEDLAPPLASFRKRFSNRLVIRHGDNRRAEELLINDEADLALTLEPGFQQDSDQIHYEPAYVVDFLAVTKRSHPFAAADTDGLEELVKHDLIVTAAGTHGRDALDHALHREGLEANVAIETDNSGFTIACVQAGMGVGILAGRPEGPLCRKLATRSLSQSLGRRKIVFMWRKGRILSEPMLELIQMVKGEPEKYASGPPQVAGPPKAGPQKSGPQKVGDE